MKKTGPDHSRLPLGIFDSGLGGLTVCAAVREILPRENILYFGDTARVPYGTKSAHTIRRYAREISEFLIARGVKALVIACNTASAHSLPDLAEEFSIPVLGVIEPGVAAALKKSPTDQIGIIATRSTIQSGRYQYLLREARPEVRVWGQPANLMVSLVEEGWSEGELAEGVVRRYMGEAPGREFDTLILGCTHFPLLKNTIQNCYPDLNLVDSSREVARSLGRRLEAEGLLNQSDREGWAEMFVTDLTPAFEDQVKLFFGRNLRPVFEVQLEH